MDCSSVASDLRLQCVVDQSLESGNLLFQFLNFMLELVKFAIAATATSPRVIAAMAGVLRVLGVGGLVAVAMAAAVAARVPWVRGAVRVIIIIVIMGVLVSPWVVAAVAAAMTVAVIRGEVRAIGLAGGAG